MLDVAKIEVVKRPGPGGSILHTAGLKLLAFEAVDFGVEHVADETVKEELVKKIWNGVYGDLHRPLMELQDYAFCYVARYGSSLDADKFSELFSKLHNFLNVPKV